MPGGAKSEREIRMEYGGNDNETKNIKEYTVYTLSKLVVDIHSLLIQFQFQTITLHTLW